MMETMIPPQVGMRLWTKKKRKAIKKRKMPKQKNERKREKGQCYYPFTTLVLQSSTMIFMIESLSFRHFHILVEFFIIELGLYIPMMGFLKLRQVFVSNRVGCTPTQFLLLSFHTFIALVHPLHGNPYSLTLISINGHLHSPLIHLVDVRLSSPFCLLHNHHSIPPYSAISMAHTHILHED